MNQAVQALELQAAFLERHLNRWFPQWARQVATAGGEGIYSVVAETAQAFISHDQDLIKIHLEKFRGQTQRPLGSYQSA